MASIRAMRDPPSLMVFAVGELEAATAALLVIDRAASMMVSFAVERDGFRMHRM